MKVGVFFGGASREREVSFAGGRTVYDNLDKDLFQAVPIFIDALGNFIHLNWEYIYRGTIRDFFPSSKFLPDFEEPYQVYSESLDLSDEDYSSMIEQVGEKWSIERIAKEIDFAFLALHGNMGEDGTIQGMLEWYGIPYSGSGILPSALGVSKHVQKKWWSQELPINNWTILKKEEWESTSKAELFNSLKSSMSMPFVAKASNQGSSIGVQLIKEDSLDSFVEMVDLCFFERVLSKEQWNASNQYEQVQDIIDLRAGLGLPIWCEGELVKRPDHLKQKMEELFANKNEIRLKAAQGESHVIFEPFIEGREFSCIVVVDDQGLPVALPPTEVIKGKEIFDYRSKYLPGLSHKQTPIQIEEHKLIAIQEACKKLFLHFEFEVYARIDGFISGDEIHLNDPNTTSGMMPSSFFFHQAAEIGLDPKSFITFIIRNSIAERLRKNSGQQTWRQLLRNLDEIISAQNQAKLNKKKVAVILGGYSSERHISVESGRNIYEKLASSKNYEPSPVFLTGSDENHQLFQIPINIMLKDNADDIHAKVMNYKVSEVMQKLRIACKSIQEKYNANSSAYDLIPMSYDDLASKFDQVFIALHGRPGEDGQVQKELDERSIPYNGSGVESSQWTINKFKTNQLLREKGYLVADSFLVQKEDWFSDESSLVSKIESFGYPLICKPHDEGCSSAVIKIDNREMLEAYAKLCFDLIARDEALEELLGLGPKDEFPNKSFFMVETFTSKGDASHFLEITGGMLTHYKDGQIVYEVFEPSEALSTGTVLTLAEKFLAGEGQNITPARFSRNREDQESISSQVKKILGEVAEILGVEGYCRIDAFVRIFPDNKIEVVIIEINSLPGMTPATCIYHQAAINHYKPYEFIDQILQYGTAKQSQTA
ncbi:MAG: D-alanine--D-alanine ligase [Bacteroidia bacterium]